MVIEKGEQSVGLMADPLPRPVEAVETPMHVDAKRPDDGFLSPHLLLLSPLPIKPSSADRREESTGAPPTT